MKKKRRSIVTRGGPILECLWIEFGFDDGESG